MGVSHHTLPINATQASGWMSQERHSEIQMYNMLNERIIGTNQGNGSHAKTNVS
jgi:hypothetical protein